MFALKGALAVAFDRHSNSAALRYEVVGGHSSFCRGHETHGLPRRLLSGSRVASPPA